MAHYALLDENNVVTQVITGIDETELIEGKTPEQWYGEFHNQKCKRTSYNTVGNVHLLGNTPFRKNYASIGDYYDEDWDAFRPKQPYASWKLDYETFIWLPPIPMPPLEEGYIWRWAEVNQEWIKLPEL